MPLSGSGFWVLQVAKDGGAEVVEPESKLVMYDEGQFGYSVPYIEMNWLACSKDSAEASVGPADSILHISPAIIYQGAAV